MIPKIIHYCWLGRGKYSSKIKYCIESWGKVLPEYKQMLWNEDSFDINTVPFVKEAYEARKFAFASDYIRLWALYNYGGVYMDTDVEILKPLDAFLHHPMFSGFEPTGNIPTGLMASEKGHEWIKELMSYYTGRSLHDEDMSYMVEGKKMMIANNIPITKSGLGYGLIQNNEYQELRNGAVFYPYDYFCPIGAGYLLEKTKNTHAIHYFENSWIPGAEKRSVKMKKGIYLFLHWFLGQRLSNMLHHWVTNRKAVKK